MDDRQLKISGHSMHPILKDGDVVELQQVVNIQKGDIVAFRHPFRDMIAVKQVVKVADDSVEVKGTHVESEDAIGEIKKSAVLGIISAWIR